MFTTADTENTEEAQRLVFLCATSVSSPVSVVKSYFLSARLKLNHYQRIGKEDVCGAYTLPAALKISAYTPAHFAKYRRLQRIATQSATCNALSPDQPQKEAVNI
jgi:hypothetical protein